MKDEIQALYDQIERDFPNGCQGLSCDECPLTPRDEVRYHLCQTLAKKIPSTEQK